MNNEDLWYLAAYFILTLVFVWQGGVDAAMKFLFFVAVVEFMRRAGRDM